MRPSGRMVRGIGMMLVLGGWGLQTVPALAEPVPDCAAIHGGALDVGLEDGAHAVREAVLTAGDTLTITFEAAAAEPFGTVIMKRFGGDSRPLLVGPSGTRVTFRASRAGPFGFEFSRDGTEPAAFKVSCTPARGTPRGGAAAAARRGERGVKLLDRSLEEVDEFAVTELAGVTLATADLPPTILKPEASPSRAPMPSPVAGSAAVDMTMQWRGGRYTADGPNGLEVDHSRSGVDASVRYRMVPEIMISTLAQVDQPGETMTSAPVELSEQGWMVGPAATIKLAPSLSLDARAAWGVAESGGDPLSARATAVPRRAVSAKLESSQAFGPWRFSPSVSLNHTQEEAFVAGLDGHDAGAPHTVGFGRVDVAPEIAYRIDLDRSLFVEPRAVIGGFWAVDNLSRLAPAHSHGDMRFKAEAGVTVGAGDGTKLQATGGVEEGEPGAADVWSGRLQLNVPMK